MNYYNYKRFCKVCEKLKPFAAKGSKDYRCVCDDCKTVNREVKKETLEKLRVLSPSRKLEKISGAKKQIESIDEYLEKLKLVVEVDSNEYEYFKMMRNEAESKLKKLLEDEQ